MKTKALLVLAIIFLGSFLGRIAVFASDDGDGAKELASKPIDDNNNAKCVSGELAAAVRDRINHLDGRETAQAERASELKAYEQQIGKRLGELETANSKLQATVETHQSARDADINKLAAIYEGMKPKQAGGIFDLMDPEFAAGLLATMNSEQAAQVVANMDSKKAYLVSVILANRSHPGG